MSTVAFDTLKFVKTLEASGIDNKQAEAIANAYRDASADQELLTKKELQIELAPIKAELQVMKWMSGLIIGGVVVLILKSFFNDRIPTKEKAALLRRLFVVRSFCG